MTCYGSKPEFADGPAHFAKFYMVGNKYKQLFIALSGPITFNLVNYGLREGDEMTE